MKIAVLDDYTGWVSQYPKWQSLSAISDIIFFSDHLTDEDALVDRLISFDIIVIERERTPFPRGLLQRLPRLRLLASTGPVNWSIDLAAAQEFGITVSCTSSTYDETPELTWGLILSLVKRISIEERALRDGVWQSGIVQRLAGKTLGILGLGNVGKRIAEFGACFNMNIVAWSHNLTQAKAAEAGAKLVSLDNLLANSDVLSIHLVLSERTRNLIGPNEFLRMKRSAYLVNTSRAAIIDQQALVAALNAGTIAGAALDVYPQEPLSRDDALRSVPNLILTPHIGYVSVEQYEVFYSEVIENVLKYSVGEKVRQLIMT